MNIIIVDDEPLARLRLRQLCGDLADQLTNTVIAEYESGTALMKGLLNPDMQAQVLLLDVNMPGIDGLELAAYLRQNAPQLAVVLVTAAAEYAVQAFDVDAVDFVLKPVRAERLLKALQKAGQRFAAGVSSAPFLPKKSVLKINVRSDAGEHLISANEVIYFRSEARFTEVVTANDILQTKQTLNELENLLAQHDCGFFRIHRNTLLCLSAVEGLDERAEGLCLKLKGSPERLTVSRRMWPQLKAQLDL
jgi:two-component system, LytTR family, response regulator AlgR